MAKRRFGKWEVVKPLGGGGQGETFLVRDTSRPNEKKGYVLKRLKSLAGHKRFASEVATLRSINHANVVRLVEAKLTTKDPHLIMEYCAGGSLAEHPTQWSADPPAALDLFAQICDGVAAAHAANITHRDIKPENVLLRTSEGPPVVADFGIAFIAGGARHTLTNEPVGARMYIAPELADGRADLVSGRSDIYSLGKLLYWLLSGGRVFDREKYRQPDYDLARRTDGNPALEHVNRILDHAITEDPTKRYANVDELAGAARLVAGLLRRDARVLASDLPQICVFCRNAEYATIAIMDGRDYENFFGCLPVTNSKWHILVCSSCGNVQLFRTDHTESKRWWGAAGNVPPAYSR